MFPPVGHFQQEMPLHHPLWIPAQLQASGEEELPGRAALEPWRGVGWEDLNQELRELGKAAPLPGQLHSKLVGSALQLLPNHPMTFKLI